MLEVQVIDNGTGIKPEDQEKLFKLFGFIETTSHLNTKGIGLGLHICQIISKEFGGDINVDSEWEKGSNFTFLLALEEQTIHSIATVKRCRNPRPA